MKKYNENGKEMATKQPEIPESFEIVFFCFKGKANVQSEQQQL